jgi:peroxiredoxin
MKRFLCVGEKYALLCQNTSKYKTPLNTQPLYPSTLRKGLLVHMCFKKGTVKVFMVTYSCLLKHYFKGLFNLWGANSSDPSRILHEQQSKLIRSNVDQITKDSLVNHEVTGVWFRSLLYGLYTTVPKLFRMLQFAFLFLTCPMLSYSEAVEDEVDKGKILKYGTYLPIEGAKITLLETGNSIFSDIEGSFEIPSSWQEGALSLSAFGYESQTVSYNRELWRRNKIFVLYQDISQTKPIHIGDSLPQLFWDIPLEVRNYPTRRNSISLREYTTDKEALILYFWATSCAPCIKQLDQWSKHYSELNRGSAFLSVHVGNQTHIQAFLEHRNWKFPVVIGENVRVLSKYFFPKDMTVGMFVVIKDGKLFAVPADKEFSIETVHCILTGKIESLESLTMFMWGGDAK